MYSQYICCVYPLCGFQGLNTGHRLGYNLPYPLSHITYLALKAMFFIKHNLTQYLNIVSWFVAFYCVKKIICPSGSGAAEPTEGQRGSEGLCQGLSGFYIQVHLRQLPRTLFSANRPGKRRCGAL